MTSGHSSEYRTLIVTSSNAGATPDGRVALLLSTLDEKTKQDETIAFELDAERIAGLRQSLAIAETLLQASQKQSRN